MHKPHQKLTNLIHNSERSRLNSGAFSFYAINYINIIVVFDTCESGASGNVLMSIYKCTYVRKRIRVTLMSHCVYVKHQIFTV